MVRVSERRIDAKFHIPTDKWKHAHVNVWLARANGILTPLKRDAQHLSIPCQSDHL
jgi:hypothetical protein